MKSAVAAMGLFAVMANAYQHPRHFHFRRDNTTAEAPGMTTLTVIATQVETITSCAPTVTSCPSRQTDIDALPESDKSTVVVTNTMVLTETVCPVSEVPAISSSLISEASQGIITGSIITSSLAPSVPLSTAPGVPIATTTTDAASPGEPTEPANPSITTSEFVTTKSLTITLGTGTDTSVVTSTYTTTVVATVTCDGGCGNSNEKGSTEVPKPTEEPTTTTTATSTGTTTVTVPKPSATEEGVPGNGNGGNNGGDNGESEGNGEGEGECKPVTVTVTASAPASTVYVTVTPEASKTQAEALPSVTSVEEPEEPEEEDDEGECVDSTTTLQTTVTVQPTGKASATPLYPIGNNGTTSGVAAPTGFARLRY